MMYDKFLEFTVKLNMSTFCRHWLSADQYWVKIDRIMTMTIQNPLNKTNGPTY